MTPLWILLTVHNNLYMNKSTTRVTRAHGSIAAWGTMLQARKSKLGGGDWIFFSIYLMLPSHITYLHTDCTYMGRYWMMPRGYITKVTQHIFHDLLPPTSTIRLQTHTNCKAAKSLNTLPHGGSFCGYSYNKIIQGIHLYFDNWIYFPSYQSHHQSKL
jgi:hypothetical protein